jgi:hypothetical protein
VLWGITRHNNISIRCEWHSIKLGRHIVPSGCARPCSNTLFYCAFTLQILSCMLARFMWKW